MIEALNNTGFAMLLSIFLPMCFGFGWIFGGFLAAVWLELKRRRQH